MATAFFGTIAKQKTAVLIEGGAAATGRDFCSRVKVKLQSNTEREWIMQKSIVSGFVAVGVAAAIIVPSTYEAHGQANSPERISPAVSQSTDRADVRIAILKADLGLTPEQAQHWSGLQSALHDIAVRRAKMWVASSELQTGRASSSSPANLGLQRTRRILAAKRPEGTSRRHRRDAQAGRRLHDRSCGSATDRRRSPAALRHTR